jgi:hypothetical protein
MPKTFYRRARQFPKNGITEFFYILPIDLVSFVHVCRHSNKLSVTKTNYII